MEIEKQSKKVEAKRAKLLNDEKESKKYIRWYSNNFDDDIGEPFQKLFWALILKQIGDNQRAKVKLAEHYKSNFYIIPKLIGKNVPDYKFWYSSNYEHREYAEYGPEQAIEKIEQYELDWMEKEFSSDAFNELREKYIKSYSKLENEDNYEKRKKIFDYARNLIPNIFKK